MTREEMFKLFHSCNNDKRLIGQRLKEYFDTHKEVLDNAPPHLLYDSSGEGKGNSVELIIEGLLKEVRVDGKET
jgi:hypothetical protein